MTAFEQIQSLLGILNHPLNKNSKIKAAARVFWWKINQLFFNIPAIIVFKNTKMKIICPPTSSYGSLIVYCNYPEYPEMRFLEKILKPNNVFIDIGANIGAYTILAASKIKKGKIYSFEPVKSVLDVLYQNILINDLMDRVTVIEKVASDQNGYEKFVSHNISEYSHISTDKTSGFMFIPSVKLDDFCKTRKISFIDVIKIDVEGAEWKVLKGFENYLKLGKVGVLIVELNKRNTFFEGGSNQIIEYLGKLNYTIYRINHQLRLEKVNKVDPGETLNVIAMLRK